MFIKRGDGKILSVIKTEELTEEQENSVKKSSQQSNKQPEVQVESADKKSGR